MRNFITVLLIAALAPSATLAQEITIRDKFVTFIEETYKTSHASQIVEHVFEVSERKNLDPMRVFSIIAVESRFNPNARNPSGATGLMQVMVPMHCKRFPDHSKCKALAFDPEHNIEVGTDILVEFKGNLRRYSGNTPGYEQLILKQQTKFQQLYKEAKSWNMQQLSIE
jgi:soluble lytic murein transglycosylase-like protein